MVESNRIGNISPTGMKTGFSRTLTLHTDSASASIFGGSHLIDRRAPQDVSRRSSAVHSLLFQLADAHDKEVGDLEKEISQLQSDGAKPSPKTSPRLDGTKRPATMVRDSAPLLPGKRQASSRTPMKATRVSAYRERAHGQTMLTYQPDSRWSATIPLAPRPAAQLGLPSDRQTQRRDQRTVFFPQSHSEAVARSKARQVSRVTAARPTSMARATPQEKERADMMLEYEDLFADFHLALSKAQLAIEDSTKRQASFMSTAVNEIQSLLISDSGGVASVETRVGSKETSPMSQVQSRRVSPISQVLNPPPAALPVSATNAVSRLAAKKLSERLIKPTAPHRNDDGVTNVSWPSFEAPHLKARDETPVPPPPLVEFASPQHPSGTTRISNPSPVRFSTSTTISRPANHAKICGNNSVGNDSTELQNCSQDEIPLHSMVIEPGYTTSTKGSHSHPSLAGAVSSRVEEALKESRKGKASGGQSSSDHQVVQLENGTFDVELGRRMSESSLNDTPTHLIDEKTLRQEGAALGLNPVWLETPTQFESFDVERMSKTASAQGGASGDQAVSISYEFKFAEPPQPVLPLSPASGWRICWNVLGLFAIVFDSLVLPMDVFKPHSGIIMYFLRCLVLGYWNVDVGFNFLVGYYDDNGNLVMSLEHIARVYMRTWFWIDTWLVVVDWCVFVLEETSFGPQISRKLRFLRFMRIFRLVRLVKVQNMLFELQDVLVSNYFGIYFHIVKTLLGILMVIHWVACMWYGIGIFVSKKRGWIAEAHFEHKSVSYRYTTCYHWAIAQFGVGEVNLEPRTTVERSFAISVCLFALLAQSTLISSVTGAMAQLRALRKGQNMEFVMLRRFCKHNHINPELTQRIQRYLRHAEKVQRRVLLASDLALFKMLSEPLRHELQLAVNRPHFVGHPLFKRLCGKSPKAMMTICATAISNYFLALGDLFFCFGETAFGMVIVVEGEFMYRKEGVEIAQEVGPRRWVSEQTLWVNAWTHRGDLVAKQESDVVVISSEMFGEVAKNFAGAFRMIAKYAKRFVAHLLKHPEDQWSDYEDPDRFDSTCKEALVVTGKPSKLLFMEKLKKRWQSSWHC